MARPLPVIAAVADITTLPAATTLLDGSGSLPSGGASAITDYLWAIVDKPTGSAAYLSDATTATPTLHDVDLEGTYIIFLIVTDDAGRSSFGTPYAVQHLPPEDLSTFDVPLYAFESPVAGAFATVRAPYASAASRLNQSLYKTGRGEYGWLATGLWPLTELLSDLRGEMLDIYDAPNKTLQADAVAPQTPGAGVEIDGLTIKDTGSIVTLDSNRPTIRSLDDFSVAAGKTLRVEATGTARFDDIASTSGGDITSTSAIAAPEVKTPLVTSTTNIAVTAAGNLTLEATVGDLTIDAVGSDVFVRSDGAFDVEVPADVQLVSTNANVTLTAADDITLTAGAEIELTPATFTTTAKPLFAPGVPLSKTVAFNFPPSAPSAAVMVLASQTITRTTYGGLLRLRASVQYTVLDADARRSDIAWRITPSGEPAQVVLLTDTKASPITQGVMQSTVEIPLVGAAILSQRLMWRTGTLTIDGAATTEDTFAAVVDTIAGDTVLIELILTPQVTKDWGDNCFINGLIEVTLSVPTAEAVL